MKRLWSKTITGCFVAALLTSPAWGSVPGQPGTVNYIEGQAAIGRQPLGENAVGSARLAAGQTLSTENGRAELLLTPGIFLRLSHHSAVEMVSPGLADTILTLRAGRAMVEVANILPENNVRIGLNEASTQLLKPGLYDFDADHGVIRVFDGKALIQRAGQNIEVKSGHQVILGGTAKLKSRSFHKETYTADDFYRWASLRAAYLAEANVDAARAYGGWGVGPSGAWYGNGWYWNAGFGAYTFIPGDGIFFDPFGWGFYSPWLAFGAPDPFYGYGFLGGYGYGYGYGYGGGRLHHFGADYRPSVAAASRAAGMAGHASHISGISARMAGFGGGSAGFRGGTGAFSGGGFHGGGGFGGGRGR